MSIIALVILFALSDSSHKKLLVGFATNAVLFCFYGAPLSTMKTVIRTKSAATISAPLCIANLVNCAVWIIYGIGLTDPFIYVPNGVGFTLNAIQFILILRYDGFRSLIPCCKRREAGDDTLSKVTVDSDDQKKLAESQNSLNRSSFDLCKDETSEKDHQSHCDNNSEHSLNGLHQETTTEVGFEC